MVQVPRVEAATPEQDVCLLEASRYGELHKVQKFIAEGADVNTYDANGVTPLIFAAMAGKVDVVRELLKHGADPRAKDSMGYDAYSAAMFFGDFKGMTISPFDEVMKLVEKKSDEEMRRSYPISGRLQNWYFRSTETSNGAWLVEGCDVWGRIVSRQGGDPDNLLAECVEYARSIDSSK